MAKRKQITLVQHTESAKTRFAGRRAPAVRYDDEIAEYICEQIAMGRSLLSVCREPNMPDAAAVIYWVKIDLCKFKAKYETAIQIRAQLHFEEVIAIADDGSGDFQLREKEDGTEYTVLNAENIQRSKLRVDTRKWELSKMQPKVFGDAQLIKLADNEGGKLPSVAPTIIVQPVRVAKDGEG
jgi:hypothetical protein